MRNHARRAPLGRPERARPSAGPPEALHSRPLHVCHVISGDLWAGAEVQVATTIGYLVERSELRISAAIFNHGPLEKCLRQLGIQVTVIDERRHGAVAMTRALTRLCRDNEVDVLHAHRYNDTVLATAAATLAGTPRVVRTVHGLREPFSGWKRLKFAAYEWLERAALRRRADLIIGVSNQIADGLRRSYRRVDVARIHNGIELRAVAAGRRREQVRRELGVAPHALLIGTVGRLDVVKGNAILLHAARRILRTRPDAIFLIVGDGPLREQLRLLAIALDIEHACIFTGARRDVYDLVNAMDVFALPSLHEGIPMALLEAMALQVPVVATEVGGVPEIIQDGVNGLLVPPDDAEALAHACLAIARDGQRARWFTARSRQLVRRSFSIERSGRALLQAYRRLARTPSRIRVLDGIGMCAGLVLHAYEKAERTITEGGERRRQEQARHHGSQHLRLALLSARRILVVCHGNIIRSAFASRLLWRAVGQHTDLSLRSAGLEAIPGRPAHPLALAEAAAHGIDLADHAACRVDSAAVDAADVIFVMDVAQLRAIRSLFPTAYSRVFLLTALAPSLPLDVADPIGGGPEVFRRCFVHITGALEPIARLLAKDERC